MYSGFCCPPARWRNSFLPGIFLRSCRPNSRRPPSLHPPRIVRHVRRTKPARARAKTPRSIISAPKGDAKQHPNSGVANEVLELRPYNPHKAQKAIEVGDFYFRRENFRAALSRYQELCSGSPVMPSPPLSQPKARETHTFSGGASQLRGVFEDSADGPQAKEARKALSNCLLP